MEEYTEFFIKGDYISGESFIVGRPTFVAPDPVLC